MSKPCFGVGVWTPVVRSNTALVVIWDKMHLYADIHHNIFHKNILCVVIRLERYVWLLYLNAMCGYYTWICVVIILEYVWLFYLNMWGYYTWICVVIILEYVWLYDLNNMCGYNSLRSMCGYMTGVCMYYRTWICVWFYDLNIRMWL